MVTPRYFLVASKVTYLHYAALAEIVSSAYPSDRGLRRNDRVGRLARELSSSERRQAKMLR